MLTNSNFYLNSVEYSKTELISFATKKLSQKDVPEWEKEMFSFIIQWLDHSDTIYVQTSGTTGVPKQIAIRKNYMINSALMTADFFGLTSQQTALLCLPVRFIAGKMMIVRAFVNNLNLITTAPLSSPIETLTQNIDFAAMIPLQIANSLHNKQAINKIRTLIIGGAPILHSTELQLQHITTQCYATYGMTETITHVAVRKLNNSKNDTNNIYKALKGISFSNDFRNCLVINAPAIGVSALKTNDIVELIDYQTFKWLGRYDNVINSGGIKLYPETIEQKIASIIKYPYFIASIPHEKLGEQIVLVIETTQVLQEKDLINTISKTVSKYELPRRIITIPQFYYTSNNKIDRKTSMQNITSFK